ncbi:MAG: DUF1178 family protein [Alphaproteobacteria bacterium]|nr:DUF1178 family protein [Alphaproteobacteria bacterium]
MIKFTLSCDDGHEFEAWFSSSDAYEQQRQDGLLLCAQCGSQQVDKALMTPRIASPERAAKDVAQKALLESWRAWSKKVREEAHVVGDKFPEEARKIHYGEVEERPIVGEASLPDIQALHEEGIQVMPLAPDPKTQN